jgi:vacuolar-type H+-ATPase subunit I/STV1
MSRRGSTKDEDEDKPTLTSSTAAKSEGGGFNPGAGDYEGEIKKAQEELKNLEEVDAKRAKGEKVDEEEQGATTDERSRIQNKIAQLRSEATRKGLRLTV